MLMMTKYELARVLGLRALALDHGEVQCVQVEDDRLRRDSLYVAALELTHKKLDAQIVRGDRSYHVNDLNPPSELQTLLDSRT